MVVIWEYRTWVCLTAGMIGWIISFRKLRWVSSWCFDLFRSWSCLSSRLWFAFFALWSMKCRSYNFSLCAFGRKQVFNSVLVTLFVNVNRLGEIHLPLKWNKWENKMVKLCVRGWLNGGNRWSELMSIIRENIELNLKSYNIDSGKECFFFFFYDCKLLFRSSVT